MTTSLEYRFVNPLKIVGETPKALLVHHVTGPSKAPKIDELWFPKSVVQTMTIRGESYITEVAQWFLDKNPDLPEL